MLLRNCEFSPSLRSMLLRLAKRSCYFCGMRIWFWIFALIALASCASSSSEFSNKSVFRYNEPGGVSSLDPAFSRNLENIWVCNQLYDGLVQLDKNLRVQPAIAKSWIVDSSQTQYHFTLRNSVFFHDNAVFENGKGRQVTAHDVRYSLQRLVARESASPGRWVLDAVARTGDSLHIKVHSDSTLTITLNQATPQFLSLLSMQYCSVVPHEAVAFYGDAFRSNPVGCGPFRFFIWKEGVKLVLHKNPSYYLKDSLGGKLPYLDAISVSFIKDQSAALMAMQRGDFDFISGLDAASKHRVLNTSGALSAEFETDFKIISTPFLKTDYLGICFGVDRALDQVALRRALSMAINREALVAYVLNGIGVPALQGFVPPSLYNSPLKLQPYLQYNPKKARSLLAALDTVPEVTIHTTSGALEVCEFVQSQWQQVGVPTQVEVMPASHHREQTASGSLALFRKSWIADYPDPENFLSLFYSPNSIPNGPNYFKYRDAKLDSLYEAANLLSGAAREEVLTAMNERISESLPAIPLFQDEVLQLCRKNIEGLSSNGMNVLDLSAVKKQPNSL